MTAIEILGLFFAGILAGEELIVRFAVGPSLGSLEPVAQTRMRQRLILRMRVAVPAVFFITLAFAIAAAVTVSGAHLLRWAAVACLLAWIAVTLIGTARINAAVLEWNPDELPSEWQRTIDTWLALDTARAVLALVAFAALLGATALA